MKILSFASNTSSPAYHRLLLPLGLMPNTDVFVTNNLLLEMFDDIDIFMYNRVLPEQHLDTIYALRRKKGFKIVVDIDDYWYLDEHHVLYKYYQEIDFAVNQIKQLSNADVVFVTNPRLATEVEIYNKQVYILPNAIPRIGQFIKYKRKSSRECKIFWQGSATHLEDIFLLRYAIEFLSGFDNIKMVVAGYNETDPVWEKIASIYTARGKAKHLIIDELSVNNYYQSYEYADLCLVPLINSRFNSMKSNLKVLEAANMKLPVIAHNVHPYKDLPIDYAQSSTDWIKNIKRLATSSKRRQEAGEYLYEYCNKHFNFKKINLERKQILEHETRKH